MGGAGLPGVGARRGCPEEKHEPTEVHEDLQEADSDSTACKRDGEKKYAVTRGSGGGVGWGLRPHISGLTHLVYDPGHLGALLLGVVF